MLTLKSNSIIKIPQREKLKKSELEKQENKTNKHIPYIIVSSFQVKNIPQEQYKIKLLRVAKVPI